MSVNQSSVTLSPEEKRRRYMAKGISIQNPVCITRSQGAKMWDDSGKEYIDFAGGIGCLNVGSTHPEVVEAIREQAGKLIHTCIHVALNEPYLDLVEALCSLAPIVGETKALLANSGVEAVENAVKIARSYTGRSAVIAFESAFHGRTNLGMSLTSKVHPYKAGFGPFVPEVYRMPYANCYHCPFGQNPETCARDCVQALESAFDTYVDAHNVAALIVEPVQGEGGFVVPPPDYLPRIREICREKGIVFIADEIQTGFGRTGEMFAVQHYAQLDPDIIVMAKSLGGGLPISAVVGKTQIMDATEVGGLGGTFGGNPVSAAAALKVLEIMERDEISRHARQVGQISMIYLRALQKEIPAIGDVRGQGAMVAMEFVKDRESREPYPEFVASVSHKALEKGLLTVKAGVYNNVIRLLAPLTISEEELKQGLDLLAEAVRETQQKLG